MRGFLISAPHAGSGKTTLTLGLLRALRDRGVELAPAKAGPDHVDRAFHMAASGAVSLNLDPWAMRPELIRILAERHCAGDRLLAVESMMGLFDGAAGSQGAPADLAALLGLPVVFVVDCARMAQSVAALVEGFNNFRADVLIAGVILNRTASAHHEQTLRDALEPGGVPVLGAVRQDSALQAPSRHPGLLKAGEREHLESLIADAAFAVTVGVDLDRIAALTAVRSDAEVRAAVPRLPPPGQRVAVGRDAAFAFAYPHVLRGWQRQGAEISFFSPLADETPVPDADAIYLPGGYPELHAGRIAGASKFLGALRAASEAKKPVYGECGGYMVLGEGLIDAEGTRHEMAGLLPVVTSYEKQRRHLGYRRLTPLAASPWRMKLTAHEFHYSTMVSEGEGDRLFTVEDSHGEREGKAGLRRGTVFGSLMHLMDRAD